MKRLLSLLIFGIFSLQAADNPMQSINDWKDVEPFAGEVVVYSSHPKSYRFSGKCFQIEGLNVGFVSTLVNEWNTGEEGYNMRRFLKKGEVPGNCALVNSLIKGADINMRKANQHEKAMILAALDRDEAELDYMFFHEKRFRAKLAEE